MYELGDGFVGYKNWVYWVNSGICGVKLIYTAR